MRRKENRQKKKYRKKKSKPERKAIFGDLAFKCRTTDAIMRIRKRLLV